MTKENAADQIMGTDKMKPLLMLSKREPVQAAIGMTASGEGLILLDKLAKPRKVMAQLRAAAGKAKLQLNPSSLRFGRAEVDPDYDASVVRIYVNKEAPGSLRPKLVEVVRKIAFKKVELIVDASLEEEGDEEAAAQMPSPDPVPAAPDAEALRKELVGLAVRIAPAAGADAGRKATLAKLAGDANAALKSGALEDVARGIAALRAALESGAAGKRALPLWQSAREATNGQLSELESAMRGRGNPLMAAIADKGLNSITESRLVKLQVALMELDGAQGAGRAKAADKARAAITDMRGFLGSHPAIRLLERNPMKVKVTLVATLGAALDTIEGSLGS